MKISNCVLEYIWVGGKNEIRSKTKVIKKFEYNIDSLTNMPDINNIPSWNYDGSSTWQADSNKNTEVVLRPCSIFYDPIRHIPGANCFLVLCDTYNNVHEPLKTNTRFIAKTIFDKKKEEIPWFGLEQEYYIRSKESAVCADLTDGYHYCGRAHKNDRIIVEKHLQACILAGLTISGINAEVVDSQWEYQIGPCIGIDSGDQFIIAKYLIERIAEKYDSYIDFNPKPHENENGSGCHINFSTDKIRKKDGIDEIYNCMNKMGQTHSEHLKVYGEGNDKRLTGIHETSSFEKFSWGIGTRNTSVRIPNQTITDGCGYFEDRRPASNIDPYLSTSIIFKTCCLDDDT